MVFVAQILDSFKIDAQVSEAPNSRTTVLASGIEEIHRYIIQMHTVILRLDIKLHQELSECGVMCR